MTHKYKKKSEISDLVHSGKVRNFWLFLFLCVTPYGNSSQYISSRLKRILKTAWLMYKVKLLDTTPPFRCHLGQVLSVQFSALNKDFFIFLAWKSIEKYFSTSQKCIQNNFSDQKSIEKYFSTSQKFIQNNFSDQKSIEKYFSISQKFIQNNFSYQKSIEKYFFNSLKFISMIFSDQKIIR